MILNLGAWPSLIASFKPCGQT